MTRIGGRRRHDHLALLDPPARAEHAPQDRPGQTHEDEQPERGVRERGDDDQREVADRVEHEPEGVGLAAQRVPHRPAAR